MIALILALTLVGFLLYLVETYVPMAPPFPVIIRVVVGILVILSLLQIFGLTNFDMPVPSFRHQVPIR